MSYRAAQWVRDAVRTADITWGAASVAHALAGYADRNGTCWPGIVELGEVTKLHTRTVERSIRALEKHGIVSVSRTCGKVNRYHFPFASALSTTSVTGAGGPDGVPPALDTPTTALRAGGPPAPSGVELLMNDAKERAAPPPEFFAARDHLRQRWRGAS